MQVSVFVDNVLKCTEPRTANTRTAYPSVAVYASDPWSPAAAVTVVRAVLVAVRWLWHWH